MKKIIILLSCIILLFTSCESFLDRSNPENAANDYFQKGDSEAEQLVNAVYSTLQRDAFYNRFLPMLCMLRSDEGCITPNGSKMEENFQTIANYNSDAAEKYTTELWRDIYLGIMRANFAIENLPNMANASEKTRTRLMGEAYFLRAFFNYHLIMIFGEGVPVKTSLSLSKDQFEQGPGADGELWQVIMDDFKTSQGFLAEVEYTNKQSNYEKGRVTVGTATAFLGQSYLFYAQMKDKPEYYQKAADELAKVILQQVGTYALEYNYRNNFTEVKEYNDESLFEIGYNFYGTDVWNVDGAAGVESTWYAMNAGMCSGCSSTSARWWNLAPSNSLLRHYEEGDYRKWMNLWCEDGAYYIDLEGVHAYNPTGTLLSMNFPPNPYPKGEDGNYIGFRKFEYDFNQAQENEEISFTGTSSRFRGTSDINFRVMRYADVLLLYAEALIMGNTSNPASKTAAECMAELRRRANNQLNPNTEETFQYLYGNSNLPYFHTPGTLPTSYPLSSDPQVQLQHERFVELAGEGKRYYDIVRWYKAGLLKDIDPGSAGFGNTVSSATALASMIKVPTFNGKFLMPIPQYELNTNPKMRGNESN